MNKSLRRALIVGALSLASVALFSAAAFPSRIARAQEPDEKQNAVVAWDTDGNSVNKKAFLGSTNNKPLILKTNNAERLRIEKDGKVGIGTTKPAHTLEINGITSMGAPGGVYGSRVQDDVGNIYPTIGFNAQGAPNYSAGAAGYGGILQFQNKDGKLIYYTGPNVAAGDPRTNTPRLTIEPDGSTGIGTVSPVAKFHVHSGSSADQYLAMVVENSEGKRGLVVRDSGYVGVGTLSGPTTEHACFTSSGGGMHYFASCSSAAEYVPTINLGKGHPEAGDLVSIAPYVKNPYPDTHGPFVVKKSGRACDNNLLGFLVDPALGANGIKLNKHYLPLAIYGYFPAKVTMENGPIQRGDPITSSSKAGYGMKATGACKIIGYALESANAEGEIQVFANSGNNAAAQVHALEQENQSLKQQLMDFEARLQYLELSAPPLTLTTAR